MAEKTHLFSILPVLLIPSIITGHSSTKTTVETNVQGEGSTYTYIESTVNGQTQTLESTESGTHTLEINSEPIQENYQPSFKPDNHIKLTTIQSHFNHWFSKLLSFFGNLFK